jgi:hypothetical protein
MKKISVLLAFLGLLVANLALAQGMAVVTSVAGSAQVQTGSAAPRALRQGDEVRQGDTVSTGSGSSLVLKFDDGEITALTQNSRMTVTAYQYEPQAQTGNVLLSLITGGMRAVTGLIGRNQPERVAYRAATATIGIRGTIVNIVVNRDVTAATVDEGSITFTYNGQTVTVSAGEGAFAANNHLTTGSASSILNQLPVDLRNLFHSTIQLGVLINIASDFQRGGITSGVSVNLPTPSSGNAAGGGGNNGAVSKQ